MNENLSNRRRTGAHYEEKAATHLRKQGYDILKMNYRCRMGEIDIVARDGRYLVFVEVKYRASYHQGGAHMAVNMRKQRQISKVAAYYLLKEQLPETTACRFDVVAIDGENISLVRNAFDYCY